MMRRILCIDGGGIKGVFPASLLSATEESIGRPITEYFDLLVGTSTGGIIALGLGLGLRPREILSFYERRGPAIFNGSGFLQALRRIVRARYDPAPLRAALEDVFADRKLGESKHRLVIPSFNLDTGEVHLWKTAHHPRLERDFHQTVVDVAMSTAAAPAYFPIHRCQSGTPLIDGGVWANNPVAIGIVEAVGVLGWDAADLRVLSLGCTTAPLDFSCRRLSWGLLGWADKITDVMMTAQSSSALGMARHLLPARENMIRISPAVAGARFSLDRVSDIPSLRGLGESEARKALPFLRNAFFDRVAPNDFTPYHNVGR